MRISDTKMSVHVLHPDVRSWAGIVPPSGVCSRLRQRHAATSILVENVEDCACRTPARESSDKGYPSDHERDDADRSGQVTHVAYPKGGHRTLMTRSHVPSSVNVMAGPLWLIHSRMAIAIPGTVDVNYPTILDSMIT
jgi:hypothetical protein